MRKLLFVFSALLLFAACEANEPLDSLTATQWEGIFRQEYTPGVGYVDDVVENDVVMSFITDSTGSYFLELSTDIPFKYKDRGNMIDLDQQENGHIYAKHWMVKERSADRLLLESTDQRVHMILDLKRTF